MKVILDFTRSWFKMRQPWPIWLGVLMLVNMMGPLFFLDTAEGQATLAVFMASAMLMMGLFAALGWVRLLGAGHFLWLGLVPWLWLRLDSIEPATALYYGVVVVIAMNSASLAIDIVTSVQWLLGAREATVTLD